jgi:hypothetical protein
MRVEPKSEKQMSWMLKPMLWMMKRRQPLPPETPACQDKA